MKNYTPCTIVLVPNGVQPGEVKRCVHIPPSGEVLWFVVCVPPDKHRELA